MRAAGLPHSDWRVVPFGEIVTETQYGTAQKANELGRGMPILRMNNITYSGQLILNDLKHVELADDELDQYTARRGDLLFNRTNSQELVGKMGVWDRDDSFAIAGYLVRIRVDPQKADPRYVSAWFNTPEMKAQLRARAKPSINMSNISASEVLKFTVPVPPLPEQRRIAEVLDRAEALRAKRRAALERLGKLSGSIFADVLKGETGPFVALGDVAELVTGYPFTSEQYTADPDGVRLCRGANVLPDRIDWSDLALWPKRLAGQFYEFELSPGDVLIAMDRPWISEGFKIARVEERDCPSLLVQRVARIRGGEQICNIVLYHLLQQPVFTRHCRPTETTVPHISPKDIRSFKFRLPPLSLQQEFARRIAAVEKLKAAHSASLAEMDALFASLQHRAFRGEL